MDFLKPHRSDLPCPLQPSPSFLTSFSTPVYHDGSSEYPIWEIINLLHGRRCAACPDHEFRSESRLLTTLTASDADIMWANLAMYASIALAMLFFWQYLWLMLPRERDR